MDPSKLQDQIEGVGMGILHLVNLYNALRAEAGMSTLSLISDTDRMVLENREALRKELEGGGENQTSDN